MARPVTYALLADAGYRVSTDVSLESRSSSDRSTGTKQDRVRDDVVNHAPDTFRISDIRLSLPEISDPPSGSS
ncbi:hypothetical protein [Lapillicoccus sp.]|uniref:hypothetical protein n=1 Tax=Lapillicoccus sp. TaxID=1909287 RepID=UPI0025E8F331|nr:hypothetical protein [Lapillicoccus sp.]